MAGLVLRGPRDIGIERLPIPVPAEDELLLRITTAGVCGTDAYFYDRGPGGPDGAVVEGPIVLGHEFAGTVAALGGGVEGFAEGDLVVSGAAVTCGRCASCRAGRTNLCRASSTAGIHRDGGLAEYCRVPAFTCEAAGAYGVEGDAAALAQPMAVAHHAVARGRLGEGERALVIGAGGIGAFATWIASQRGAEVTVVDLLPDRLAIAARLGAERTVAGDLTTELADERFDVIYECTGSAEALTGALASARGGTRVVMVGIQKRDHRLASLAMVVEELELIGSAAHVCAVDLPKALEFVARRRESWADVAPEVLALDRVIDEAIVPLAERRAPHIKALVDPSAAATRAYRGLEG